MVVSGLTPLTRKSSRDRGTLTPALWLKYQVCWVELGAAEEASSQYFVGDITAESLQLGRLSHDMIRACRYGPSSRRWVPGSEPNPTCEYPHQKGCLLANGTQDVPGFLASHLVASCWLAGHDGPQDRCIFHNPTTSQTICWVLFLPRRLLVNSVSPQGPHRVGLTVSFGVRLAPLSCILMYTYDQCSSQSSFHVDRCRR